MDRLDSIHNCLHIQLLALACMIELHDSLLCLYRVSRIPWPAKISQQLPQILTYGLTKPHIIATHSHTMSLPFLPASLAVSCLPSPYIGYRRDGAEAIILQPKVFRLLCGNTPPPTYSLPFTLGRGRPGPVSDSFENVQAWRSSSLLKILRCLSVA